MNSSYPGGGYPFRPSTSMTGTQWLGGLTELQAREHESKLKPLWTNLRGIPDDISGVVILASYGVEGNGTNDDGPGLSAADAVDGLSVLLSANQVFRVGDDITLSGHTLARGGILKPDSGATITIDGPFEAPLLQCFDLSAGGSVVFGAGAVTQVYPEWWGADPTGVADSLPAFEAARDAVGPYETIVVPPMGTYRLSDTLVITDEHQAWVAWGAQLNIDHDGVGVRIGQASVRTRHVKWNGGRFRRVDGKDWTPGITALELLNVSGAKISRPDIFGFHTGVHLIGRTSAHGTTNVDLELDWISDCLFGVEILADDNGWCNENTIRQGKIGYSSSAGDASSGAAIRLRKVGTGPVINNNHIAFVEMGCSLTGSNVPQALIIDGRDNHFAYCRFEGYTDPFITLTGDASAGGNLFGWSRGLDNPSVQVTGGTGFHFFGRTGNHLGGGSSTDPVLNLKENNSNSNRTLVVQNTSGNRSFSVTGSGGVLIGNDNPDNTISRVLTRSTTWDPASIDDGASAGTTVSVPGASVGDLVLVSFTSITSGLMELHASVTSNGTVGVRLWNKTGSAVDLGEGTLRAMVFQVPS